MIIVYKAIDQSMYDEIQRNQYFTPREQPGVPYPNVARRVDQAVKYGATHRLAMQIPEDGIELLDGGNYRLRPHLRYSNNSNKNHRTF